MNYIGSKLKLSDFIEETIRSSVGPLKDKIFCDIFAGSGVVGRHFKSLTREVISNDIEYYSYILNRNYIANNHTLDYSHLIEELNSIDGVEGFIYTHYCVAGHGDRRYFSDHNAKKIDAIRVKIEEWRESSYIDEDRYYFLLASLIESADKVANTASVYGAYLKHLKKSAQKELLLKPAHFDISGDNHRVYQEDANSLISKISGDVLYMDPPYNQRQYGANYHLLNTIALYDQFVPQGKSGLREYTRSDYCKKSRVKESFEELISRADFEYIFLSYNNEGLMSCSQVEDIMSRYGEYSLATTSYQRFKADKNRNRKHKATSTVEYIHILKK
ncbi:Modification methylase NlaIII [hydrothermal vent metagenome]|uniref:site-specific DNA-methyltransferase (adenine-specific) n=1 Tax=hydrothermal vent metagenome TaxID=652676 RepID=A0A1W1CAT8_9ZZZZ